MLFGLEPETSKQLQINFLNFSFKSGLTIADKLNRVRQLQDSLVCNQIITKFYNILNMNTNDITCTTLVSFDSTQFH